MPIQRQSYCFALAVTEEFKTQARSNHQSTWNNLQPTGRVRYSGANGRWGSSTLQFLDDRERNQHLAVEAM